jgi:trehalose-phosphatase
MTHADQDSAHRAPPGPELHDALNQIAETPQLLVGSDYDGTLARLVDDPALAAPLPEALITLSALAELPHTIVAVVSGRALRDLAALIALPDAVRVVGCHGAEIDVEHAGQPDPDVRDLHERLQTELRGITLAHPGVRLETKPAGHAVHVRGVDAETGARARRAVLHGPARWPGVHVTTGKDVIELSTVAYDKGRALEALRRETSASAVLYIGDDDTDEDAFATLAGADVGVKVGPELTRAAHRVPGPDDAVQVLRLVVERRKHWLARSAGGTA